MKVYNAYISMKCSVGTRVEEDVAARVKRLALADESSEAVILRKCIVRYLPTLEREILGEQFVEDRRVEEEVEHAS
jgi:hypothetical protein